MEYLCGDYQRLLKWEEALSDPCVQVGSHLDMLTLSLGACVIFGTFLSTASGVMFSVFVFFTLVTMSTA